MKTAASGGIDQIQSAGVVVVEVVKVELVSGSPKYSGMSMGVFGLLLLLRLLETKLRTTWTCRR